MTEQFLHGEQFLHRIVTDVSHGTGIVGRELTNGSEGGTMTCGRCEGFMIVEISSVYGEASARSELQRTRCLNCGNVEDSVICLNRVDRSSAQGSFARLREGIRL